MNTCKLRSFSFGVFLFGVSLSPLTLSSDLFQKNEHIIQTFEAQLKQKLMLAMKEGGPKNAVKVCAVDAPLITDKLSEEYGVRLRRVSDKNRNINNRLSDLDKDIFAYFKRGDNDSQVFYQEVSSDQSVYAKPIKAKAMCLTCHGDSIESSVATALKASYPHDLATGYQVDDLRGMFVIEREIEKGSELGIKNFKVLSDDLWVGGQPSSQQLAKLKAMGVKHIINLRAPSEMKIDEAQIADNLGMKYVSLPISGAKDITFANSSRLSAEMKRVDGPVYLHCASSNRVGALLALGASKQGANLDVSLEKGRSAGMLSLEKTVIKVLEADEVIRK